MNQWMAALCFVLLGAPVMAEPQSHTGPDSREKAPRVRAVKVLKPTVVSLTKLSNQDQTFLEGIAGKKVLKDLRDKNKCFDEFGRELVKSIHGSPSLESQIEGNRKIYGLTGVVFTLYIEVDRYESRGPDRQDLQIVKKGPCGLGKVVLRAEITDGTFVGMNETELTSKDVDSNDTGKIYQGALADLKSKLRPRQNPPPTVDLNNWLQFVQ